MEQFLRVSRFRVSTNFFSIRIGIKKKKKKKDICSGDSESHTSSSMSSDTEDSVRLVVSIESRANERNIRTHRRTLFGSRSWQKERQKEACTCFVPLIHVEAVTIQFHDDNQRCKSRLQYRNPRRPRTRYRGVVLDSFLRIRSAFGTGVRTHKHPPAFTYQFEYRQPREFKWIRSCITSWFISIIKVSRATGFQRRLIINFFPPRNYFLSSEGRRRMNKVDTNSGDSSSEKRKEKGKFL